MKQQSSYDVIGLHSQSGPTVVYNKVIFINDKWLPHRIHRFVNGDDKSSKIWIICNGMK